MVTVPCPADKREGKGSPAVWGISYHVSHCDRRQQVEGGEGIRECELSLFPHPHPQPDRAIFLC